MFIIYLSKVEQNIYIYCKTKNIPYNPNSAMRPSKAFLETGLGIYEVKPCWEYSPGLSSSKDYI